MSGKELGRRQPGIKWRLELLPIERCVENRNWSDASHGTIVCVQANVEPDLKAWPQLARALLFGPLSAIPFRLSGPDCLPNAGERIAAEARALGTVVSSTFSSEQAAQLHALAAARKDSNFAEFVDRIL